jgi:hypothetical protein
VRESEQCFESRDESNQVEWRGMEWITSNGLADHERERKSAMD